ncbi:DUF456 domain-containing protein [Nocardioides speluncae]|uniref:DUF456 domain-containing protein n=1 Tax=Nocardioides speluncae TaxID=2670337 RepID=UPI001F0B7842|nr:DUF456 domain-containing protein [Nocardioides speluncae]
MTLTEVAVGIAILVGLAGIIVPVLPGSILVLGAIVAWALEVGGTTAWIVVAVATTFLVVGTVVKYLIPGRQMKAEGIPNSTLWIGALFAIVGFFVVPVVGMLVGFVAGVYVAERQRVGADDAWPSTKSALKAVGISILIELAAALLATGTWIVGVVVT